MKHETNFVYLILLLIIENGISTYDIKFHDTSSIVRKLQSLYYSFADQEKKKLRSMSVMRITIMVITIHQLERLDT